MLLQPRDAQGKSETSQGRIFSYILRVWPCQHLDFEILASRTEISFCFSKPLSLRCWVTIALGTNSLVLPVPSPTLIQGKFGYLLQEHILVEAFLLVQYFFFFHLFFKFYFIFKLYIIVLVLPNIKMNPPQVYMCSPS